MSNKAVIYTRLSREDEDKIDGNKDSRSIENQIKILTDFAKDNNLEIVDIYIDDGISGASIDRPDFNRLMNDARYGKFNILLIKDISRLGRAFHQVGKLIDYDFPSLNIRIIAPGDNYDSLTYNDDESIVIRNYLNDYYLKDFKKKIHRSLIHRSENKHMKSGPKYGYIDDEYGNRIVDPIASIVIKRIFNEYVNGISTKEIARKLNEDGILTKSAYVNRYISKKYHNENPIWTQGMVAKIIQDYEYCGHVINMKRSDIFERKILRDKLPKIIDEELFERANKIMSSKTKRYNEEIHIAKLIYDSVYNKHPSYSLAEGKPKYPFRQAGFSLDVEVINNIVYKECLNTIAECLVNTDKFYELFKKKLFGHQVINKDQLEKELLTLNKEYERLLEDYFEGKLTKNIFNNKSEDLQYNIRYKENEINNYNTYVAKVKLFERKFYAFIEDTKELPTTDIELIKECVSKITIVNLGGTKKNRKFDVIIKFKFEDIN